MEREPTQTSAPPVVGSEAEARPTEALLDLEGVRRRDPAALDAFFERYFDRVYAVVTRLLGNRTQAEDAAQEVFFKIHRAAHTLDPTRDPGPWISAIATNVCRDHWRSAADRMARRSASIEDTPGLSERLTTGIADPERDAIMAERERLVREAVTELREPYREVVVLREYNGLEYGEIATIVGANEAAVRKRYSRALAELGRTLKKKGL